MVDLKEIAVAVMAMHPTFSHFPLAVHPNPEVFLGMEKSVLQPLQLPIPVEHTRTKRLYVLELLLLCG